MAYDVLTILAFTMGLLTFLVTFPVNVRTFIVTFWPDSAIGKEAHSTNNEIKQNTATTAVAITKIEGHAMKRRSQVSSQSRANESQ